jgi:Tol biopolymer transport system component
MFQIKLRTIIAVTIASLSLFVTTAFAQQNTREIFERARMLDESNQNLSEAIKLYGQVVSQSNEQRALAARARFRIGVLYERLGRKADAQRAFQTVVKQYGDQSDVAGRARAKLPASAKTKASPKSRTASESSAPTVRQVWAGPDVETEGAPSPDGRYLSFMDKKSKNLAIRDLTTGDSRLMTNDAGPNGHCPACAYESIWSPDGKQIVYGWLTQENSDKYKDEALELRIIGIDGSGKRVLYRPDGPIYAWPFDWSSDGKYILAGLQNGPGPVTPLQIAMISVADGAVRIVKTLNNWNYRLSKKIFFSPDGRYIVYSAPVKEGSPARDIFLLSTDGTREVPLIQSPADDYALGWLPSGSGIVFTSDRTGSKDLWALSVVDGKPQGAPQFVKRDVGSLQPLGLTRSGALFYAVSAGVEDTLSAKLDLENRKVLSDPTSLFPAGTGSNYSGRWSPDGRKLSYIAGAWQGPAFGSDSKLVPRAIVIRDIETGAEREIVPQLAEFEGADWSPDGRSLVVSGIAKDGGQGFYRIDAQTGETTALVLNGPGERISYKAFSPEGETVFYGSRSDAKFFIVGRNLQSNEKKILYGPTEDYLNNLVISPDGKWLAFRSQRLTGPVPHSGAIMVIPTSGGEPRELIRVKDEALLQGSRGPARRGQAWTANGQHLLFSMRADTTTGEYDLWRVRADGGTPEKLGLRMTDLAVLMIHPDGQQIMFVAGTRGRQEIWTMENFLPRQQAREQSRTTLSRRR